MSDVLIALSVLAGLGLALWLLQRKSGTERRRDQFDPEAPRNVERGHTRTEAEIAKADTDRLSEADAAQVAELHEYFQEIGTGELPVVVPFDVDPLSAPIPAGRAVAEPTVFQDVWAERLSLFTWTPPPAFLPLSSVQVSEPEPFEMESFTRGWTREQIDAIVADAKAKAGASR